MQAHKKNSQSPNQNSYIAELKYHFQKSFFKIFADIEFSEFFKNLDNEFENTMSCLSI